MTTSRTPRKRSIRPEQRGFDVTYEVNIGFIAFDEAGEDNPVAAAFRLIGDHVWRMEEGGKFHFPGPGEDQTITVEVTTT